MFMLKSILTFFIFFIALSGKSATILITGASQGIGKCTAEIFYEKGHNVYAGVRQLDKSKLIKYKQVLLDVTKPNTISKAVKSIISSDGKIDILINNAGTAIYGPTESILVSEFQDVFDVNFFGVIRVIHEVLPSMKSHKKGTIINISSIAGQVPLTGFDSYNSSKAALESVSESMIGPLSKFNVRIHVIEPGPVNTNFTSNMKIGSKESSFLQFNKKAVSFFQKKTRKGQDPRDVAKIILKIANESRDFRIPTSPYVKEKVEEHKQDQNIFASSTKNFMSLLEILDIK